MNIINYKFIRFGFCLHCISLAIWNASQIVCPAKKKRSYALGLNATIKIAQSVLRKIIAQNFAFKWILYIKLIWAHFTKIVVYGECFETYIANAECVSHLKKCRILFEMQQLELIRFLWLNSITNDWTHDLIKIQWPNQVVLTSFSIQSDPLSFFRDSKLTIANSVISFSCCKWNLSS